MMPEPCRIAEHAHAGPINPVLYSFRRCPYAMRARLAIAVSRTACVLREVKLSAKPEPLLDASPKGTVPVLVLADGTVIDESIDIMRWALALRDPEGWLEGDDPALIDHNDDPFKHALDRYKYPERHDADPLVHRASGLEFMREIDARLRSSAHLSGHTRSITDAAIMPFIRQFAAVDQPWFDDLPLLRLKAWLADYTSSDLFNRIMFRTKPWSPSQPPLMFPSSSEGEPR